MSDKRIVVTIDMDGDEEHESVIVEHILGHVSQMDGVDDLSLDYTIDEDEDPSVTTIKIVGEEPLPEFGARWCPSCRQEDALQINDVGEVHCSRSECKYVPLSQEWFTRRIKGGEDELNTFPR